MDEEGQVNCSIECLAVFSEVGIGNIIHFQSGGPVSRRFMARNPAVLQIGSTVFVHGGLLPSHVEYGLERINK